MSEAIAEARAGGARLQPACAAVGLTLRTYRRWHRGGTLKADARRREHRPETRRYDPPNRLSPDERDLVLEVANAPRFASSSPHQIVAALADEGRYLASESTFYRLLRAEDQLTPRTRKAPPRPRPQPWEATGPNQVWTWDITYLATNLRGTFFYLYLILDIYSRKIVGWEVYPEESTEHAAALFERAHLRAAVGLADLVLHSDNGSPMKGATMLATLQRLGVVPSFSRPSVSNDNPYSEAGFATLKGSPAYPEQPFESLEHARTWVATFVLWYNETHRHSALKFVTPGQRHRGEDRAVLAQRDALYQAAKATSPARWSGPTRNWEPPASVLLEPRQAPLHAGPRPGARPVTALTPPRDPTRQASELYTGLLFLLPENPRSRDGGRIAAHPQTPNRTSPGTRLRNS